MEHTTEYTEALASANAMPAPTWHRLKVSDAEVMLPADQPIESCVSFELDGIRLVDCENEDFTPFDAALSAFQEEIDAQVSNQAPRAVETAARQVEETGNLDLPALSLYQREAVLQEICGSVADAFCTGMGDEAYSFLREVAGGRTVLVAPAENDCSATLRVAAVDGASSAACVDVVAEAGSTLKLLISYEGEAGSGFVGSAIRVFAGKGSKIEVHSVQSLTGDVTVFDDSGYVLEPAAHAIVTHRVLGAAKAFTGLAADLRGEGSRIDVATRYIGASQQQRDFNYSVKQRGKCTESSMDANGVLSGSSKKTLRGTIDFVHGCKGSLGNERETVLLADDEVENKTVPVILCDEDDVMGNHGATIGHVRPEQRFYLNCRGLSDSAIESLFSAAAIEEAYLELDDQKVRHQIELLAAERGVDMSALSDYQEQEA